MARLIASLVVLMTFCIAAPAAAQPAGRITCSSQNYRPAFCPVDNIDDARLVTTLGGNCSEGRSWRWNRRGIEVDSGCRGVFEYRTRFAGGGYPGSGYPGGGYPGSGYPGGGYPGGGYPGGGATSVTCESRNYRPQRCAMDTRGNVRLVGVIGGSPCRQGQTWGIERGAVWVNGGCRARFASVGYAGGYPGGGNPGGIIIECSSRDYRPARCPANVGAGVQLVTVLGGECIEGRSWRWNRRGVEVFDGCRARFRVF